MIKDIKSAIESRLSNPFLGYLFFAFFSLNWKPAFYLVFANENVLARFKYFESETSIYSMLIVPVLLAGFFAAAYPWVQYFFLRLAKKPSYLKNNLQAESEHEILVVKQELEETRNKLLATAERELIDRAKRDEELDEIGDVDKRESLRTEIEELRKERNAVVHESVTRNEAPDAGKLIEIAKSHREQAKTASSEDKTRLMKQARELEDLAHALILKNA